MNADVRPSDLFRDHLLGCFIDDRAGIEVRRAIGIDNIMFERDYPTATATSPRAAEVLADVLRDVPDADARKIAEDNAAASSVPPTMTRTTASPGDLGREQA